MKTNDTFKTVYFFNPAVLHILPRKSIHIKKILKNYDPNQKTAITTNRSCAWSMLQSEFHEAWRTSSFRQWEELSNEFANTENLFFTFYSLLGWAKLCLKKTPEPKARMKTQPYEFAF